MKVQYRKVTSQLLSVFREIVGEEYVLANADQMANYAHDHTEDLVYYPEVVIKASKAEEISQILTLCNKELIPVTVRGAGTGLSGGALPVLGGVLLSMERFNKILDIDEQNFQATVEPGVINEVFQHTVQAKGLFYPPDPASKGSCFLGGNLAHSAGGPRALKYGTTRDYVLNMEVILASGEIIWTGANTLKYSTGYNLTHLMIGSEGTLAVITKIVFKLIPLPKHNLLLFATFADAEMACTAVANVFRAGYTPSCCEFMERDGLMLSATMHNLSFDLHKEVAACLLIEVDGNEMEKLHVEAEQIAEVLYTMGCLDILLADSAERKDFFWKLRRSIGEAVKTRSVYKEEDAVVPRAELPVLMKGLKELEAKYGFKSVSYGHAGDGNLHINILKESLTTEQWNGMINEVIREIFQLCVKLKGTISGEHGIGLVQKNFMDIPLTPIHFRLMQGIKQVFDPNQILNPGKIIPDIFG